ncbi:hypothetical protein YC2023_072564 [Brassica napus]
MEDLKSAEDTLHKEADVPKEADIKERQVSNKLKYRTKGLTQAPRQDCTGDVAFYSGEENTEKITCDSRRWEIYKDPAFTFLCYVR